jgi:hypothetical protein
MELQIELDAAWGRASEEEPMDQQEKGLAAQQPAAGLPTGAPAGLSVDLPAESPAGSRALYLPFGGTDPDFYFPADHERKSGGISRWFRELPVFGRTRP